MMQGLPRKEDLPVLVVEDLVKHFRGKPALEKVAFTVPEASFTVLLGPAGAGKTTTLRIIAGLDQPGAGRALLNGRDVAGWEPKDRNIAMILDNLALYPNKTGFENIANPLRIRGMKKAEIETRVADMAHLLKIGHTLKRLPKTMSGGERQRIALGRALIRTPSLFLLDEPLSSLDAKLRIELRAELRRLQRERGCSFLMATPDYNEAMAIADSVIMLRQGKVVQTAAPQTLYDEPVDREAALFVGAPRINLAAARLEPGRNGGRILTAGGSLPVPAHFWNILPQRPFAFELGIRPENLELAAPEAASIRGELADIEPLGLKAALTVKNDAGELRVLTTSARARSVRLGDNLGLAIKNPATLNAFDAQSGKNLGM